MRRDLLQLTGTLPRDPAIETWFRSQHPDLAPIALRWFKCMRACGDEVRELLHDGCPVACLGDTPFAYVNVFRSHVNAGFFQGASLPDPAHLLEGSGRCMRHVKLRPGVPIDDAALTRLIEAAYADIKARLEHG